MRGSVSLSWFVRSVGFQRDANARRRMFRKFDSSLIPGLIVLTWTIMMVDLACGQLIRPISVYEGLIKDIRAYFNNTCIIVLHSNPRSIEMQGEKQNGETENFICQNRFFEYTESCYLTGFTESELLLRLQKYLSSTLHIRTAFMDFHMFTTQVSA